MRIRAGESDREMIGALGVDIGTLYTIVFALGAALAGLAGAMVGALQSVQVGMGEPVLILAFVVIVIGGIGSIKGALVGAMLVGVTDTMGRVLLPIAARRLSWSPPRATPSARALASMLIYIVMALDPGLPAATACSRRRADDDPRNHRQLASWPACCCRRRSPPALLGEPFYVTLATRMAILALAGRRPQPGARLRRAGLLRPRRLLRHRRLCRRHPRQPRVQRRAAADLAVRDRRHQMPVIWLVAHVACRPGRAARSARSACAPAASTSS